MSLQRIRWHAIRSAQRNMLQLNNVYVRFLSACIIISFAITCFIALLPISTIENCDCKAESSAAAAVVASNDRYSIDHSEANHRMAILVPFRDRFDELLQFVPHMTSFLNRQGVAFHIFVLNQIDRYRFNRASLINVGYLYTKNEFDYIAMHDVDLLPLNPNLHYDYPEDGPIHIAAPELHPKYHYKSFVGGILLVNREHFAVLNGMSNRYWGWGLEDDEFYVRIKDAHLEVKRPTNISTGVTDTFLHVHDRAHRKRDTAKCFNQREVTRKRDRDTGLATVDYIIKNVNEMAIDGIAKVTVLNIQLKCDRDLTPWCDCSAESNNH